MLTKKEFATSMINKGRSEEWGLGEWARRWGSGQYRTDKCPDTGLPRISAHGATTEIDYNSMGKTKRVIQGATRVPLHVFGDGFNLLCFDDVSYRLLV